MEMTPGPRERELHRRVAELLDDEIAPLVRRMAYRSPHGAGGDAAETDDAAVREMVWKALTELGATRLTPLQEQAVLAEHLGHVLCQGPLPDTLLAARALSRCVPDTVSDRIVKEIGAGARVAAAVRDGGLRPQAAPLCVTTTGDDAPGTVTATRHFVTAAAEADYLLIPGRTATGTWHTALVRRDHPTVRLRRHDELGRGESYAVRLTGTPVTAWLDLGNDPEGVWQELLADARIVQAAYLVGLSHGALQIGVGYVKTRRQFGMALSRQQSIAFCLARHATCIDAARLLARAAAWERDSGVDARLSAAQALAMAATLARDCTRDVLHLHGARGMVEDCDTQLYYRRAAVESLALGSPSRLRAEVWPLLRAAQRNGRP